jgi:hypothetical protein
MTTDYTFAQQKEHGEWIDRDFATRKVDSTKPAFLNQTNFTSSRI